MHLSDRVSLEVLVDYCCNLLLLLLVPTYCCNITFATSRYKDAATSLLKLILHFVAPLSIWIVI